VADISESQLYTADAASSHRNAPALLGVAAGDEVIVGPIEAIDGTSHGEQRTGDVRHAAPGRM
jgi:hypothetical protein